MKKWIRVVGGALLTLIGTNWILQGSNAYGMTGGMNGKTEWLWARGGGEVVGPLLLVSGIRRLNSGPRS